MLELVAAFVLGAAVGWLAYRFTVTTGAKLISKDSASALKFFDGIGYSALVRLRDAADAEIAKRRGEDA